MLYNFNEYAENTKSELTSKEYLSGIIKEAIRKQIPINEEDVKITVPGMEKESEQLDEGMFRSIADRIRSVFSTVDFNSVSFQAYETPEGITYIFTNKENQNYVYEIEGGKIIHAHENISSGEYQIMMFDVIQNNGRQINSQRKIKSLFTRLNRKIETDARFRLSPIRAVAAVMAGAAALSTEELANMGVEMYDSAGQFVIDKSAEISMDAGQTVDMETYNTLSDDAAQAQADAAQAQADAAQAQAEFDDRMTGASFTAQEVMSEMNIESQATWNYVTDIVPEGATQSNIASLVDSISGLSDTHIDFLREVGASFGDTEMIALQIENLEPYQLEAIMNAEGLGDYNMLEMTNLINEGAPLTDVGAENMSGFMLSMEHLQFIADQPDSIKSSAGFMSQQERYDFIIHQLQQEGML